MRRLRAAISRFVSNTFLGRSPSISSLIGSVIVRLRCIAYEIYTRWKLSRKRQGSVAAFPLHRPHADIAAAEALRPANAIHRRIGAALRLAHVLADR